MIYLCNLMCVLRLGLDLNIFRHWVHSNCKPSMCFASMWSLRLVETLDTFPHCTHCHTGELNSSVVFFMKDWTRLSTSRRMKKHWQTKTSAWSISSMTVHCTTRSVMYQISVVIWQRSVNIWQNVVSMFAWLPIYNTRCAVQCMHFTQTNFIAA